MSKHDHPPSSSKPPISRRRFLARAGLLYGAVSTLKSLPAIAAGSAAGGVADPHPAQQPATPDIVRDGPGTAEARLLRFVHTHTGETLTARYFAGGAYDEACLRDVNHLLRDFRTNETHVIDPPLLDVLFQLQVRADHDAAFEIISGYRSPATNAMLRRQSHGVAEHSQHLLGKAIDIRLAGYSTRNLAEHARSLGLGGVGFYPNLDFVHVDTGRVRFW
jgi:uncharacterized protein YcbK (DUF882 family)